MILNDNVLALWEQTICEIRLEIKSFDVVEPPKIPDVSMSSKSRALSLCDKLEKSMCASAGGRYPLLYDLYDLGD